MENCGNCLGYRIGLLVSNGISAVFLRQKPLYFQTPFSQLSRMPKFTRSVLGSSRQAVFTVVCNSAGGWISVDA